MFKNAVISMLLSIIWHMTMCEFNAWTLICLASVLFFIVLAIEDAVDTIKKRMAFKRRIQKKIAQTKISPTAGKAS
jgi:hypothetical protein